jgi:hypothetical protein
LAAIAISQRFFRLNLDNNFSKANQVRIEFLLYLLLPVHQLEPGMSVTRNTLRGELKVKALLIDGLRSRSPSSCKPRNTLP